MKTERQKEKIEKFRQEMQRLEALNGPNVGSWHIGLSPIQWTVQKDPSDCLSKSTGLMLPVRRHMKWNSLRCELLEYLAHPFGHSMRRIYGVASAGFRWSVV